MTQSTHGAAVALGETMRAERERQNLRQEDVAQRTGLSMGTIVNIEKGYTRCRFDVLSRYLAVLGYRLTVEKDS